MKHDGAEICEGTGARLPRSEERPRSPSPRTMPSPATGISKREARAAVLFEVSPNKKNECDRGQNCTQWHPPNCILHKREHPAREASVLSLTKKESDEPLGPGQRIPEGHEEGIESISVAVEVLSLEARGNSQQLHSCTTTSEETFRRLIFDTETTKFERHSDWTNARYDSQCFLF